MAPLYQPPYSYQLWTPYSDKIYTSGGFLLNLGAMLDYLIKDFKTKRMHSLTGENFSFRRATSDASDVDTIVGLVESVYRGEGSKRGWTTEADILGGQRTDREMIKHLLSDSDCLFLVCEHNGKIVGSVHLERKMHYAYLGMLSVDINYQNMKLGRLIIDRAEDLVKTEWHLSEMRMTVIDFRAELIAWYERRGYKKTGAVLEFPKDVRFGVPKVEQITLVELAKSLSSEK